MSDDIKWNKDKHDDNADKWARELLRDSIKKMFDDWRRMLCSKTRTKEELIQAIDELKVAFQKLVASSAGGVDPEYIQFTHELLESQVAKIMAETFVTKNSLTEYIPTYTTDGSEPGPFSKRKPRKYNFKNAAEFYAIPFVREMAGREDFLCFLRDGQWVRGILKSGEPIALGKLANMMGVENMVTLDQFQAEVKKLPEPQPTSPAPEGSQSTTPGVSGSSDSFAA